MKYLPPEPKIDLYNQGFGTDDFLGRSQTGKQLSELVEKIEEPFVLALDGAWGSGKSHFLSCWVGAHQLENGGNAKTVYIDAFQHDFLEEPLIALTAEISKRLVGDVKSSKAWKAAKTAAAKLWRPAARIGLAVGTAGLTEVVGVIADTALAAGEAELQKQVDAFWRSEESKSAAMKQFRSALIELTKPDQADDPPKKLVVVIDELDRCRPDYALSMLEVVKHFFAVPNVHFVIGVNLVELQNSVRARYGAGVDARTYLQKFITFSMSLPNLFQERGQYHQANLVYFKRMSESMGLDVKLVEEVLWYFENFQKSRPKSLRGMQKVLTQMALIPLPQEGFKKINQGYGTLIAGLTLQKFLDPIFYENAKSGNLKMVDVENAFDMQPIASEKTDHATSIMNAVWAYCLAPANLPDEKDPYRIWGSHARFQSSHEIIPNVIRDYLETIKLVADRT